MAETNFTCQQSGPHLGYSFSQLLHTKMSFQIGMQIASHVETLDLRCKIESLKTQLIPINSSAWAPGEILGHIWIDMCIFSLFFVAKRRVYTYIVIVIYIYI